MGRLGKQKRRRLDRRRNKGRNLKQSAVVQGRRAPRRLLIWLAPPATLALAPPPPPRPAPHTTRILIANLPDNAQIDNAIIPQLAYYLALSNYDSFKFSYWLFCKSALCVYVIVSCFTVLIVKYSFGILILLNWQVSLIVYFIGNVKRLIYVSFVIIIYLHIILYF